LGNEELTKGRAVMIKRVVFGLFVLAVLGCVAGIATRNAYVYILGFMILVGAIFSGLLISAANLIWRLLPGNLKRAYKGKQGRFNAIIFFSAVLFYVAVGVINGVCLLYPSGYISLLGNTTTFVFVVFFGWSLIRRSKGKTIVAGSVVFILFIASLSFVNSITLKSERIAEVNPTEKLKSLGYVSWSAVEENIEKTGVTLYDRELASDGLNFYSSQISPEAYLRDMHGNILHKWAKKVEGRSGWHVHAELCENGDLVVAANTYLIRLDWSSNIKWKKRIRAHHDVAIGKNGDLYVPVFEHKLAFWHGIPVPIVYDNIVVLSSEGKIKKKVCVYEMVKDRIPLFEITKPYIGILKLLKPKNMLLLCKNIFIFSRLSTSFILGETHFSITHLNSIEIMDRNIEGFCSKGDWLISMRELDLIGIVDTKNEKFTWSWGPGKLDRQHHPTLLQNGNVLIFDNGWHRGFSRIVELNPLTKKIVWEYKSDPPQQFFTIDRGGNQRLPNGNTLIAQSEKGRVFEITKDGKVVWEFYNPDVRKKERAAIYRMMRTTNPKIYKLLKM